MDEEFIFPFDAVTVKIWHGGRFKNVSNGDLVYEGGVGRTFAVDPDEICYFYLIELGKKCGDYEIEGVFYLIPGLNLTNGLRKVNGDNECRDMIDLALKFRCVDVYIYHGLHKEPTISPTPAPKTQTHVDVMSSDTFQI